MPGINRSYRRVSNVYGGRTAGERPRAQGRALEIIERHLNDLRLKGHTPGTIYARRRALVRMAALIGTPLWSASEEDLRAWREALTVTDNTVRQYASHARNFYDWCIAQGHVEDNPAARLMVPLKVRGLPRPISEEDFIHAVTGAPRRIRPWLALAGGAGLRAKEIALLRRDRVLDTRRPPVLLIAADATKGRRERLVEMSTFVLGELRAHGLARAGYLFPRADGRPGPNTPARVSQAANAYLHAAGIEATLHQLRHRFGTELYALTRDIRLVQEKLGHADPATTAGYTAYSTTAAAEAIEALPAPGRLRVAQ